MPDFSLTRRKFSLGAAAATAALVLPGQAVIGNCGKAQSTGATPTAQASPMPAPMLEQQAQTAMAKLSPAAQAEVEMKFQDIVRKYGEKLSAEQKTDVRKVLAETQEGLESLRAYALENGDQPAAAFHIYRGEGKK